MKINPAKTALLVLDFQGTILASLPDADSLVERVADAIAAVRATDCTVAYVRVAFTEEELTYFPAYSAMGQRMNSMGEAVLMDAPATQVDSRLAPQPGDIVVRKRRVGPFSTTDLDAQLRQKGIDTLVLCGIHTSGCVLTGVREAHDLDYRIFVLADCCADPDPRINEFLTATILPRQAEVASVADLRAALPVTGTNARDELEIRALYIAYNRAIDSGDAAGWAATFVDDGNFHHPARTWSGQGELCEFVQRRGARLSDDPIADQRHWNDAITVTLNGDRATAG
ncbi:MAG TPA: isochorismatase family protein, partial [Paraburkholderia sp.]